MKKKDIISLFIWISGFSIILLTVLYVAPLIGYFVKSDSALAYVDANNNFVAYGGAVIITKNFFVYYFCSIIPILTSGIYLGRLLMRIGNKNKREDREDPPNVRLKF